MTAIRRMPARPETVVVEVVVNHDDLRRGERGPVELNAYVRARLDKGYLKLADEPVIDDGAAPARALGSTADRPPVAGTLLGVDGVPSAVTFTRGGNDDQGGTLHPPAGPGAH